MWIRPQGGNWGPRVRAIWLAAPRDDPPPASPERRPRHPPVAFTWCNPQMGGATAALGSLWKHQYIDGELVMDPVSLTSVLESTSLPSLTETLKLEGVGF